MRIADRIARLWSGLPHPLPGGGGPWLRVGASAHGVHLWFVLASVPAVIVALLMRPDAAPAFVGMLATGLATSLLLHVAFALLRGSAIDPAWFLHAWMFALLMPTDVPLSVAALGIAFGIVVGALIFGGAGRYLVSPALLGVVFLELGYPAQLATVDSTGAWARVAAGEGLPGDWWQAFLLHDAAQLGAASPAACLAGFVVLVAVGVASWRSGVGALLGVALAAAALGLPGDAAAVGPQWHWVLGTFPFCAAFVLTDPSASAVTRPGRWLYGALFGALVVALRVGNPEHPEGTFSALLFAALFAPLIDQLCQRAILWRWRRRRPA